MNNHNPNVADSLPRPRKRYLIHREMQLQFVGILLMITLLTAAQMLVQVFMLDVDVVSKAAKYGLNRDPLMTSFIVVQHKALLMKMFFFLLINMVLVAAFGLFFSHRVSGPIYRTQQHLKRIAAGDFSRDLVFRKTDLFREVADTVNQTIEVLRQRNQRAISELETIRTMISMKPGSKTAENPATNNEAAHLLEKTIADLRLPRPQ